MTADIKLLSLPEADGFMETFDTYGCPVGSEDAWGEETVKETIRANVAHATEPLKAEIERLRAEIAEWKASYQQAADACLAYAERIVPARNPQPTTTSDRISGKKAVRAFVDELWRQR